MISHASQKSFNNQHHDPFGMLLVGRNWEGGSEYRYGFQNQELDNEYFGGAVNYKYRVEDARLGRFFSGDPLFKKYPGTSTYSFSFNRLIDGIELEGAEYLNSSTARFNFINGVVAINLDNMGSVFKNRYYNHIEVHGQGSISTIIADPEFVVSITSNYPQQSSMSDSDVKSSPNLGAQKETIIDQQVSKTPNYKVGKNAKGGSKTEGMKISMEFSGGTQPKAGAIAFAMIDFAATFLNWRASYLYQSSVEKLDEQTQEYVPLVLNDLKIGIERGYVPQEYINNETFLFNVANYILQGTLSNTTANPVGTTPEQYKRDVEEVGLKIYTLVSLPNKTLSQTTEK